MATQKQESATHKNTKKAQDNQLNTGGRGLFYRIQVRPKDEFITFRTHDVGDRGHLERLAGKRADGSWDTVTWLISKKDAHVTNKDKLVIDNPDVRTVLKQISGEIIHKKGNVFEAHPRKNTSEKNTPNEDRKESRYSKKTKKMEGVRHEK